MAPLIPEVEDVNEVVAGLEQRQPHLVFVDQAAVEIVFLIDHSDPCAVAKPELMQMCRVPAGKAEIDSGRQLTE